MSFTPETARIYGIKGGKANVAKNGVEHMSKIGLRGGETMKKRGRAYYASIGRRSNINKMKGTPWQKNQSIPQE